MFTKMLKITLLMLMSCMLLASSQTLKKMNERVKDRVVHFETLLSRGRWLWQNDNKDTDGSRYLYIDKLNERDTYFTPRVQFKATACGTHLCFESVSLRDYYLAGGFPPNVGKYTVKLQHSTYIKDDDRFHWDVMCEDGSMERCKIVPIRFKDDGYLLVADNWGSVNGYAGGHYDATLGKEEGDAWFRVHAPNPSDRYVEIYSNTNKGNTDQEAEYSTTIGVTKTTSSSHSITTTVSMEIGGAFKAFSASVSASIEDSWQHTEESAFSTSTTITHKLTIPARTSIVLKQLVGNYADQFDVKDDHYIIEETPLDGGETKTKKM